MVSKKEEDLILEKEISQMLNHLVKDGVLEMKIINGVKHWRKK